LQWRDGVRQHRRRASSFFARKRFGGIAFAKFTVTVKLGERAINSDKIGADHKFRNDLHHETLPYLPGDENGQDADAEILVYQQSERVEQDPPADQSKPHFQPYPREAADLTRRFGARIGPAKKHRLPHRGRIACRTMDR
jgi:murein DD-endopeptidase MepM/ murein hydrolase activator NlpD